ncbi:MAG: hypothetical protein H0T79_02910 [Deltaproteobacteria bacterium]|nr:hypothetical protein [Deltaproteobacteria bacterium]
MSIEGAGFTDDQQWEASKVLWPRCMGGDLWSCRMAHLWGEYSLSDLPEARDACTRGFAYACTSVSIRTEDSDLLGKACEMGDPGACVRAQKVASPKRDRWAERAQALFLRGCDAGLWEDCISLGTLPEGPLRTAVDSRGYDLAVASCLAADSRACNTLHRFANKSIELRLRTVRCAVSPADCRRLAEVYLTGSVMHNQGSARLAYEMSCLADPPGYMYEWKRDDCVAGAKLSREIDDDGVRADVMSKRACALGEVTACTGKVGGTP